MATVGAIVAISSLAYIAMTTQGAMLLGSFGASALLLFALPDAPLSQPRSVIGGHLAASLIAFGCLTLFGPQWWAIGLATGLGVGFMMITRTVHPPAGSNAIIVFLTKPACGLLLASTLAGTVLLVAIAIIYHRVTRAHKYPHYWRISSAGPAHTRPIRPATATVPPTIDSSDLDPAPKPASSPSSTTSLAT